jgi:sigma-B regulation protein RsbU (phosphoserine phosphatase)
MRLRTQLSLAFLLLAVLPLFGMTLYSYRTSQRAFRHAVEAEAAALAGDMTARLEAVAGELAVRIHRMRERPREESAFEAARREALAAAERAELRLLLRAAVAGTPREEGSLPFALDEDGRLYAPDDESLARLQELGLGPADAEGRASAAGAWVVVKRPYPALAITVGVARPVGEALASIRDTAVRNLALGLGIVLLALVGILPLSRRMTRHLAALTDGAERLAGGDLDVRVPVPHGRELARLASTFNRMARELALQQERRAEQERMRKELEIGRRIQAALLPRTPLSMAGAEVDGLSIPAREVSGDFYDYFPLADEAMALLVGDVSGKGVPAALLMANLQATLRARLGHERDLARLADGLDREMAAEGPFAPYLTLFLAVLEGRARRLRYVNAGHHAPFLLRGDGRIERLATTGRPPGLYSGGGYEERSVALTAGDALFLYTDGVVEAEDEAGEPFGHERLEAVLRVHRSARIDGLLASVDDAWRAHHGRLEPADDATMLAMTLGAPAGAGLGA